MDPWTECTLSRPSQTGNAGRSSDEWAAEVLRRQFIVPDIKAQNVANRDGDDIREGGKSVGEVTERVHCRVPRMCSQNLKYAAIHNEPYAIS